MRVVVKICQDEGEVGPGVGPRPARRQNPQALLSAAEVAVVTVVADCMIVEERATHVEAAAFRSMADDDSFSSDVLLSLLLQGDFDCLPRLRMPYQH